jgi:hypothetical protein
MQRFLLLNYYYWHDDHLQELYCQKLRQWKNSKLAHHEDIEAQIFCHTMWAMVLLDKNNFEHEMLGLLEEVQTLMTMRDEKGKVESENASKLPVDQIKQERMKLYYECIIDIGDAPYANLHIDGVIKQINLDHINQF